MKHRSGFFLCLLGTLPLGCVLDKYDSDWIKDTGGNVGGSGLTVGGGSNTNRTAGGASSSNTATAHVGGNASNVGGTSNTAAVGGSGTSNTMANTLGGSSNPASLGGASNLGGSLGTIGGGTSTGASVGGSTAPNTATGVGGSSNTNAGGSVGVGGLASVGGTRTVGGNPSSGGTASNVGGSSATVTSATGGLGAFGGNNTTNVVPTGGSKPNTGGASAATGGASAAGGSAGVGGASTTGGTSAGGTAAGGSTALLAKAITTGESHTCALLKDGTVYCWGNNCDGQLGDGTQASACGMIGGGNVPWTATPVQVKNLSAVTALTSGYRHSCAISGGRVYCWGYGNDGQLGNGTSGSEYISSTPVAVSDITNATSLAAGEKFTCALLDDATVKCWGNNDNGELGDGTANSKNTPVTVVSDTNVSVPLSQVTSIVAGSTHACAVQAGGSSVCWGLNSFGQLGSGDNESGLGPISTKLSNVSELSASYENTCARLSDRSMTCVGCGYFGELGTGTKDNSFNAVSPILPPPAEVDSIALGQSYTCAILSSDKSIMCWGLNWAGQLGVGYQSDEPVLSPAPVTGFSGVVTIAAKVAHTCALAGDGTAYCWGFGDTGQLGNGSNASSNTPRRVLSF